MKPQTALFLFLSAVTVPAARADTDALAGHWRGTVGSRLGESALELQFDQASSGYRGHYWSTTPAGTSFPVDELRGSRSIRFAVPNIGIFEGEMHGDSLDGTYTGPAGSGQFHVVKAPAPDDLQFVD